MRQKRNGSLKHRLRFKNARRGAPQVGGAIATGARGTAAVRASGRISFEMKKLVGRTDWPQRSRQTNAAEVNCQNLRAERRSLATMGVSCPCSR
jgi:hypothetical protein